MGGSSKKSSRSQSQSQAKAQAAQQQQPIFQAAPSGPDPMIDYLNKMQEQQNAQAAAAAEAQRQAILQAQLASSQQMAQQGEQQAAQQLATANSMQSIRDANALLASKQAQSQAGQQATGGGFDVNASRQQALTNLGATSGMIPTTPSNFMDQYQSNPAAMGLSKKANTFSLPQTSDLKFGGA